MIHNPIDDMPPEIGEIVEANKRYIADLAPELQSEPAIAGAAYLLRLIAVPLTLRPGRGTNARVMEFEQELTTRGRGHKAVDAVVALFERNTDLVRWSRVRILSDTSPLDSSQAALPMIRKACEAWERTMKRYGGDVAKKKKPMTGAEKLKARQQQVGNA